jgi:hypothetical protein
MPKKLTLDKFIEAYSGAPLDESDLIDRCMSKLEPNTPLYNRAVALFVARETFYDMLDECEFEVG